MSDTWTIAQAALIINKPAESLRKAVEHAPIKPEKSKQGRKEVYAFKMHDLIFYCALDDLKAVLTRPKQAELLKKLMATPKPAEIASVEIGHLRYDLSSFVRAVRDSINAVQKRDALIETSGPEPTIKGTDISAYRIAALCEGMTTEEIVVDYPALSEDQIAAAKAFAASHPKPGRPYPRTTAKRALLTARADASEFLPRRK